MSRNPANSARLALGKVLGQLDKAKQRVAELEAVVSELSASLNGVKAAKIVLPKALTPLPDPPDFAPDAPLDEQDVLGAGRWC